MRSVGYLRLAAALVSAPAAAQSNMPSLDVAPRAGPNAQAAQRPAGPNAQAAHGQEGPNGALARSGKQVHYPSCAAAGVVRSPPIRRGEPGYGRHLDRDGDGIACD